MATKESMGITLYGDLDGITVGSLKKMLDDYPDHARIDVRSERIPQVGGWSNREREFFVIVWDE